MWKTVKLHDVCEVITKGTTPTSVGFKFENDGINFVKVESIYSDGTFLPSKFAKISEDCHLTLKRSQLFEGDILFSIAGALGRTAIVTKEIVPANTNQALAILRLKSDADVDKKFLLYFLNSDGVKKQSNSNKGGVAQQNLSLTQLKNYLILLPPLAEQKRIVAKLDKTFAEINKSIGIQKIKITEIDSLFNSYISKTFQNRQESWEKKSLKDLCENYKKNIVDGPFGSNLKSEHFIDEGFPVLKIQNIKEFSINQKKMSYISKKKFDDLKRHSFKTGDIIMTKLGQPLGVSAIVKDLKEGVIVADLVRIRADRINTEFLCFQLNSPIVNSYINSMQKGATRPRIKLSIVRELPIYLPNSSKQEQIVRKIKEFKSHIDIIKKSYEDKMQNLSLLKSSLINDLVNTNKKAA